MHKLELSVSSDGISESGEIIKCGAWHSNIFANFFASYQGHNIDISFPNDLLFQVYGRRWGRSGRYGHFEVRLNGTLCTVCIGDNSYYYPIHHAKSKAKISFISQVRSSDLEYLKERYRETFHRIYPIPLPLYWHSKEISSGEYEYKVGDKKFVSSMFFSLKSRSNRLPWLHCAMTFPEQFKMDRLSGIDFLKFCVNDQMWGVNLKGHGMGNKCYRESEYMCMGVPMALNYKTVYPFSFNPGEHYFYMKSPNDLQKLKDIDPEPFAKASKELGERYIKQEGFLDLMMRCINQKEYNPILGDI